MLLLTRLALLRASVRDLRANSLVTWLWLKWAINMSIWSLVFLGRIYALCLLGAYMGVFVADPPYQQEFMLFINNVLSYLPPIFWLALLFCTDNIFGVRLPKVEQVA